MTADNTQELGEILADWEHEVTGTPKHWDKTTDRLAIDTKYKQAILDWHNKQIAKARLDTARRARVLHVINLDGTGGQAELGFEVALDKTIPYSEYAAELSQTLKEHKEQ